MSDSGEVVVVGAGVVGLTSAYALLEAGYRVAILADKPTSDTTSAVAAGIWFPYAVNERRVPRWGAETFEWLLRLVGSEAGVRRVPFECLVPDHDREPEWSSLDVSFQPIDEGFSVVLPVADSKRFLPWLQEQVLDLGATMLTKKIRRFEDIGTPIVVNCTGLGARELCDDGEMFPIRGTVVRVENPGIERGFADDRDPNRPTYFIPLSAGVVLGGTAVVGDESLESEPEVVSDIIERCSRREPLLAQSRVLEARTGLRPGRTRVRLEHEVLEGGATVVHNYGHGGAGYTLAWGCAQEVVRLVSGLAL